MARLLSELLFSPVTGPIRGLRFIVNRINDQVEAELLDEGKVQAELLDLTMRYERGEVDDAHFEEQQQAILERLNEIREYKQQQQLASEEEE